MVFDPEDAKRKPTIAVDFDGVLHDMKKWSASTIIDGEPVPGAMNFIRHLTSAFDVIIFSARFSGYDGMEAVGVAQSWMLKHMAEDSMQQSRRGKSAYEAAVILSKLHFTAQKPAARIYLDDRAWQFNGTFPSIPDLLKFKTWQKR